MRTFDAGFDGTLAPGIRPAVVSVDLMRAYFDPQSPLCLPDKEFLDAAAEVLGSARGNGVPVLHTRVRFGPGGADGGVFIRKVPALRLLIGETELGQLMPEVSPVEGETVLVKQFASAFFGTDLAQLLHTRGVDTLVIVGTSTSGCIRATAVDAMQHGFIPIVVGNAVGDRDAAVHGGSLYDLQAKYAEIWDSADVLEYFRGDLARP
ncbi:isochorismatase family protein [Arthrobacter sp. Helios]|uniref:isochorismatase family protein n=1 Tax=Arthrobacter sp. Helios TaxID=2828862 RepID=UPI0020690394|nr:isochorismatase family protein [Arthrobacter sp. Helios]UPO77172.1 isochorismatase family protein [Arthrobacter sp. Helios]